MSRAQTLSRLAVGATFNGTAVVVPDLNDSSLTANRLVFAGAGGNLQTSTALQFDGTNLGLGVTPSAWSSYRALQLAGGGSLVSFGNAAEVWSNAFFNGSNNVYIANGFATRYHANNNGAHAWYTAPSGTAGAAISFTQAMTLDASGRLVVGGTTAAGRIASVQDGYACFTAMASGSGAGQTAMVLKVTDNGAANFANAQYDALSHRWITDGSERARITNGGAFVIGDTYVDNGSRLTVVGGSITVDGFGSGHGVAFRRAFETTDNLKIYAGPVSVGGRNGGLRLTAFDGIAFGVNSNTWNEVARFDTSGNLLVGMTSPSATGTGQLYVNANVNNWYAASIYNNNTSFPYGLLIQMAAASAPQQFLICRYAGVNQLLIGFNGNVTNTNGSYGAISDAKLKENVTDATPKLEKLNQVRVVNFNLIGETQKQIGVIAQELEQIFPGMVEETMDRDEEGNDLGTTTKSVKYSVFVPMLIKAIQELKAEFDAYKATHP